MSELLVSVYDEQLSAETRPELRSVPDLAPLPYGSKSYLAPEEDERGRVTRPAMLVEEGIMPNGQPVHVFYDRGRGVDSYEQADLVLARAARTLALINKLESSI